MLVIAAAAQTASVLATDEEFDPNTVTPGVWGFVLFFAIIVVTILLVLDMVRRIRRTNMRAQVRAQLEAEARDAELADADGQVIDANGENRGTDAPGETPNDDDDRPGGTSATS